MYLQLFAIFCHLFISVITAPPFFCWPTPSSFSTNCMYRSTTMKPTISYVFLIKGINITNNKELPVAFRSTKVISLLIKSACLEWVY